MIQIVWELIIKYYLDAAAIVSVGVSIISLFDSRKANGEISEANKKVDEANARTDKANARVDEINIKIDQVSSEYKEKIKLPGIHQSLTKLHSDMSKLLTNETFNIILFNNKVNECIAILDQASGFLDENISLKKLNMRPVTDIDNGWEMYRCVGYIIRILDGNIQDFVLKGN